jgi:hypothetical protein
LIPDYENGTPSEKSINFFVFINLEKEHAKFFFVNDDVTYGNTADELMNALQHGHKIEDWH